MKKIRLLLAAMLLGLNAFALLAQKVTVNCQNEKLGVVLNALERQTGYTFYHSRPTVNPDRIVSLQVKDTELKTALDLLFGGTEVDYRIDRKKVYLVKRETGTASAGLPKSSKVRGTVTDNDGLPAISVGVLIKGTQNGVVTDSEGNYEIDASPSDILVFSSLGYVSQEITVGKKAIIDVTLASDSEMMDEVVVIGFGTIRKRDVSTAISSIKADDIANKPNSDLRLSMAGKMAGITVMQTSGDPEGSNLMVRVRGVNSATAGNDPLYIIDGIPMENGLTNLNPNDIESLEVLKDASSAAIYGSRGSNGVIIVTTKSGKKDKLTVSYDGYYGVEKVSKKIDMLSAYEFAVMAKEGHDNAYYDLHPGGTDINGERPESFSNWPVELIPYLNGEPGLTDTDWQDEIFRKASTTSHNISISGKSNNVKYFISGNYFYKEGIIINSDFEKYSLRLNLDGKSGRFKYGVNFSPSYSKSNRVDASGAYNDGGIVQSALASVPLWSVYNPDGTFNYRGNGYWRIGTDYQHNEVLNPVALATLQSDVVSRMAMTGKVFAGYDITPWLNFQTSVGGSFYGAHNDQYRSSELPLRGKAYYDAKSNPVGYSSSGFYFNYLIENQFTFDKRFGGHTINAILVQSAQKETYMGDSVKATDYPNDYIRTINGGTVTDGSSKTEQWSIASYLARVQYSYKEKYMFSAALRADGSSRFGKNNRWGYFPSASAAWRISGEDFFRSTASLNWVDDLKIRTSYGQTGNFQIGNYTHLSTMDSDDYILGKGSGSLNRGYKPTGIENPDLTWEKTSMVNFGLDLTALKGLAALTAEFYYANTTDMLLDVPIPQLTGHSTTLMNVGKVNNRGIELTFTSQKAFASGLGYSFSANWAKNINEVKKLGANDTPIIETGSTSHDFFITRVGDPIGSYYLLVQDGVFKNEDELNSYPHFSNTRVGDFRFVDVDGDGVLNTDKDRAVVGNYMPDFTYGFGGNVSWKGFDLQLAFQGVYGNEILNLNRRYLASVEGNVNMMRLTLNRWQSPENPGDGKTNRANRKSTGYNGRTSTWHIEDGSYLRLQNAAIGYTLPRRITQKAAIEKLRVYISGQNLATWTKYTGYNPEVSLKSSALTPGIDYGTYPLAKTITMGANITF